MKHLNFKWKIFSVESVFIEVQQHNFLCPDQQEFTWAHLCGICWTTLSLAHSLHSSCYINSISFLDYVCYHPWDFSDPSLWPWLFPHLWFLVFDHLECTSSHLGPVLLYWTLWFIYLAVFHPLPCNCNTPALLMSRLNPVIQAPILLR